MSVEQNLKILGLKNLATQEEIKQAYRGLVKRHHPDRNKGKKGEFLKIQEAYEYLINQKPSSKQNKVIKYEINISPQEALYGTNKTLKTEFPITCSICLGAGIRTNKEKTATCYACNGIGTKEHLIYYNIKIPPKTKNHTIIKCKSKNTTQNTAKGLPILHALVKIVPSLFFKNSLKYITSAISRPKNVWRSLTPHKKALLLISFIISSLLLAPLWTEIFKIDRLTNNIDMIIFILKTIDMVTYEIGHSISHWVLGYHGFQSVFSDITIKTTHSWLVPGAIYALIIYTFILGIKNKKVKKLSFTLLLLYSFILLSPYKWVIIYSSGILGQLSLVYFIFYSFIHNNTRNSFKTFIYLLLGFYLSLQTILLACHLSFSSSQVFYARDYYAQDLSALASSSGLSLGSIGGILLILSLISITGPLFKR